MLFYFVFHCLLLSCTALFFGRGKHSSTVNSLNRSQSYEKETINDCEPPILYGSEWILSQMREDYGWGEQTHRAVTILAVNDQDISEIKWDLIVHQLEVELAKALMRNESEPIPLSDLALYVHALLAVKKDPRNFYGVDLVNVLRYRVDLKTSVHPFPVLALCNAGVLHRRHLQKIRNYLRISTQPNRQQMELMALAVAAFACAEKEVQDFHNEFINAANSLAGMQRDDGSFGNVYTTSVVIQALTAVKTSAMIPWQEDKALEFLNEAMKENVNMISVYYTEMARNAHKLKTLKNIGEKTPPPTNAWLDLVELKRSPRVYYVQYTLRVGDQPEIYHTVTIKVPANATTFDIMRLAEDEDSKFRFSYYVDAYKKPAIYSISGIPNDAEQSLYWRFLLETEKSETNYGRHRSNIVERSSPYDVQPPQDSHVIYWYRDGFSVVPGVNKL